MTSPATGKSAPERGDDTALVLQVLREFALETVGPRAARAVSPTASLERDVGLGSLERAELLMRLELALGREVGDEFLLMDSAEAIAAALATRAPGAMRRPSATRAVAVPEAVAVSADTIHGALRQHATLERDRPHVYLRADDGTEQVISYGALWDGAARVAAGLRARGVARGETVAIMLPTGFDFLRVFQGILVTGAVPVPLYPPVRLDRLEEYLRRQRGILVNAGARCLVTLAEAAPVAHLLRREAPSLREVTTASSLDTAAGSVDPAAVEALGGPSEAALIQYTSGSTGAPKGVELTHANLLANIDAIARGVEMRPTDVGASWLPLYHDMGLIGTWLCCMVRGIPVALQSPLSFLARPERWLWAIHRRRATLSPAPNFAYELCVRKIRDEALEGLDLSSWRCALNGSEPVSPDTLDRFARRFERYGFQRESLMPVYGLAECSVALCVPPVGRGPRVDRVERLVFEREGRAVPAARDEDGALRFVSVGTALPGHEVRIVAADAAAAEEVPERVVGRIVFRGPSVTAGYHGNAEATAAVSLPGGWMDSGDLGYRAGGELYVTGRRKDLIIKGGRNLVPQEIEEVAAAVDGVRKGCVAAFGVADPTQGTEQLVVVAETRTTEPAEWTALEAAVIARVAEVVGLPPDRVVVVPPGSVPKTPSGKIQRGETKARYLAGALGVRPRLSFRRRATLARGWAGAAAGAAVRRAGRWVYVAYFTLAFGAALATFGLASWLAAAVIPSRRLAFTLQRVGARLALRIAGCPLSAEGMDHLRGRGPLVLAANHSSYADTPAMIALLPLDFVFVAKREVLSWPLVGTFVRRARHPTVDRLDPERGLADYEAIARRVRGGETALFFPEGTFTRAAGLRPFRMGAFETAVATQTPVVPLALTGTRHVLPSGRSFPRPGPIHLWVGAPIAPDGEGWEAAVRLRDRVADAIATHCGEPRLELVASGLAGARPS
ncbi:MAG TPA: AMP-binding protein [Gemmatimonadaceae bacterium]|nr:AMP-binding protein [Gemmatimonadaceae bacterium]